MIEKIKNAAFQGNLLQKTIRFVFTKLPVILLQKLDWYLGKIVRFLYAAFTKVDKRQIMFICFQGDYTCNPKYIAEELRKRNVTYNIVFSARKASMKSGDAFPAGFRQVEQYSRDFYQEIAKSKLVIANSVEFLKNPTYKKKAQIYMETWHGSLGIKRFGEKENHGKSWVAAAKRCGKLADCIISNSSFEDNVYRDTFWKTTPILRYGHPRNDILFSRDSRLKTAIRDKVLAGREELAGHRLALYAPTFRDSHTLSCYNVDFERVRRALSDRFGGEWSILAHLHPTVRKLARRYTADNNVVDVTAYPDIHELMVISDIAITDYSSWIYDFILTKRPGFIFATDMNTYVTERGFYYPITSTPFPIASNNDKLVCNILSFDEEDYQRKVDGFLREKGCVDDGHAAQRAADKIIELMGDTV